MRKGSDFGVTQLIGDLTDRKLGVSKHGGRQLEANLVADQTERGLRRSGSSLRKAAIRWSK